MVDRARADPVVRPATVEDAPRIADLSGSLGYAVEPAVIMQRLERLLARPDHLVVVAELAGNTVVGWVHGTDLELLETGRRCEILGLVVDPEHRTRGIGRKLVSAIELWAVRRGLTQIGVRSNVVRLESHPFYEQIGYTRVKTQHAYRKSLAASTA